MTPTQAASYLASFRGPPPANPESGFLRDRVFDMVLEGTPVEQRRLAASLREISIRPPEEAEGLRVEAQHFCGLVSDCEWGPFPPEEDRILPGPRAVENLHARRGGTPDDAYRSRLSALECGQLVYSWGAAHTLPTSSTPESEVLATYPDLPYSEFRGEWWIGYYARKDPDPCLSMDYSLDDAASGMDVKLKHVFGFFRKYYAQEVAEPMGALAGGKTDLAGMGYSTSGAVPPPNTEGLLPGGGGGDGGGGKHRRSAF